MQDAGGMQQGPGFDSALCNLQVRSAFKPAQPLQQAVAPHFGQHHLGLGHSVAIAEAVALAAEQAAESGEDLDTPANGEAQAGLQKLEDGAAAAAGAAQQCLFCGGLGTQEVCGSLRPAFCDGQAVSVHHLCAIWSPSVYTSQGSSEYVNLASEAKRARQRSCSACGQAGASITCSHAGCRCAYHLPCALGAPNVMLEQDTFELWCPHHSDTDNSDEEYQAARPRRQTGSHGGTGKRQRGSAEAQRPRTDWQKKDDNTWLKVVPPWWCEHRTVHFATKVYKELFKSAPNAIVVDPAGGEWVCLVQTEARNDLRPQYTLRGAFAELWESQGISSGDTLIFKRDSLTGSIELSRHAAGSSAAAFGKMDEGSELSDPSTLEGSGARSHRAQARQEATSEPTRGMSQQGSHPNRWMELGDGWNIKTVYKSTMAHQQCPIAGWLFKKLYGRLPGDTDRALMYDPDLDTEYRFDVNFIGAANVHYIAGQTFGSWIREAGLQAGEQIRMKKDAAHVLIQRVPSDRKVRVDFTTKMASRTASLAGMSEAAVAGAPASHGQELASPPTAEALEALDALVAAAGYAGTHGTPAIHAALADSTGAAGAVAAALAAAGLPGVAEALVQQGVALGAMQPPAPPKRRRTGQGEFGSAAELLLQQQEQQVLLARQRHGTGGWSKGGGAQQVSAGTLENWQPSALHVQMFRAINDILAAHEWSPEEQTVLLRFRAKYAWLDGCGREVMYLTVTQLQADKPALLEFLRSAGQGILTQLQGAPAAAGTATAGPAPATGAAPASGAAGPPLGRSQRSGGAPVAAHVAASGGSPPAVQLQSVAAPMAAEPGAVTTRPLGLEDAASINLDMLLGATYSLGATHAA